jgi:hypothetical protein
LRRPDAGRSRLIVAPGLSVIYDADARRMTMIEGSTDLDGKLRKRAGIVIDVSDGRRRSSADIGGFRKSVDPALAAFLSDKTRLPLNFAQTEAEIPKLEIDVQPGTQ